MDKKKVSPFVLLEIALLFGAGFLIFYGNVLAIGGLAAADPIAVTILTLGFVISILAFFIALLVTVPNRGDPDVKDLTAVNVLTTPLIVGNIFTLGSFLDESPTAQVLFLDMGLIMGLFFFFALLWIKLKDKWDFLEVDVNLTDKSTHPQFLLATLILGAVLSGLFLIFKLIYLGIASSGLPTATETAYNWTVYPFVFIIFFFPIILAIGPDKIISRIKNLSSKGKKKPAPPAKKAAPPAKKAAPPAKKAEEKKIE